MAGPTRVAVLGAGAWGANHVRALVADPAATVVAIADPDPASRERAAQLAPGARWCADATGLLGDPGIDAFVIASPSSTHAALAAGALAAGHHVLVEKPLALSLAEAQGLAALAARGPAGRVAMVGHLMVYHPGVQQLRALVRSGVLGPLRYLHAIRANLGRVRRDESVLWSFGPHDLSMIELLLGDPPVSVSARGQCVLQPGIEDVVFLTLRFPGGVLAQVQLSWLHPRKERRLTVVGADKMADFDDIASDKLRIYDRGAEVAPAFTQFAEYLTLRDGDVHIPRVPMAEPLQRELRHFLDCIARGTPPETDLAAGVRVVAVLDAAQRSLAADGAPIEISQAYAHEPARDGLISPSPGVNVGALGDH